MGHQLVGDLAGRRMRRVEGLQALRSDADRVHPPV
jgi:hypothetical protein